MNDNKDAFDPWREWAEKSWARASAHRIVDGALSARERSGGPLPSADQISPLRRIARRSLCTSELRRRGAKPDRYLTMENLRQPNPLDDDSSGGRDHQ